MNKEALDKFGTVTPPEATITDEQVHQVYTELNKTDSDAGKLKAAEEAETEATLSPMDNATDVSVTGVDTSQVNEGESDYKEAFSPYNISDEDTIKLLELIADFKKGNRKKIYEKLPKQMQAIADGLRMQAGQVKFSKDNAAAFLLDSFINDAKINKAVADFEVEFEDTMKTINKEYAMIYSDTIEEIFSSIDKIEAEEPERAALIKSIKQAFDDATTFSRQEEYIDHINKKKLVKHHGGKNITGDAFYFNKRVNVTEIKVPDIGELPIIIANNLPDYDIETINQFVSVMVKTMVSLPLEGPENLSNIAYVYRTVANIYDYKYSGDPESEKYNTIFGNISKILDKIENLS